MSVFETIKAAVPIRNAAEHYGLRVLPNGMTRCPFHEDRHPSLKLNEDYFYCFGCHATGDVINFTAKLWDLSPHDAAEKLMDDFGISEEQEPLPFPTSAEPYRDPVRLCICVLWEYLRQLRIWQVEYRPEMPGVQMHPHSEEALKHIPMVSYYLDCLRDKSQAAETARMLCEAGHIARLSRYLSTLSVEETEECA